MSTNPRPLKVPILPSGHWPQVALQEANAAGDGKVHLCVDCSDRLVHDEDDDGRTCDWTLQAWIGGSGVAPAERRKILAGTVRFGGIGDAPEPLLVYVNPLGLSEQIAERLLCVLFEETCRSNFDLHGELPDPMCVILPDIAAVAESLGISRWF